MTDKDFDRGRLPCPVGTNKAENSPSIESEAQVINGDKVAVAFCDVLDTDERFFDVHFQVS